MTEVSLITKLSLFIIFPLSRARRDEVLFRIIYNLPRQQVCNYVSLNIILRFISTLFLF